MPIVVSRHTGQILSCPEYTQEDYDRAWEAIAKNWAKKHPEELAAAIAKDNMSLKDRDTMKGGVLL